MLSTTLLRQTYDKYWPNLRCPSTPLQHALRETFSDGQPNPRSPPTTPLPPPPTHVNINLTLTPPPSSRCFLTTTLLFSRTQSHTKLDFAPHPTPRPQRPNRRRPLPHIHLPRSVMVVAKTEEQAPCSSNVSVSGACFGVSSSYSSYRASSRAGVRTKLAWDLWRRDALRVARGLESLTWARQRWATVHEY